MSKPDYSHLMTVQMKDLKTGRYYCAYCADWRNDEGQVRNHIANSHLVPDAERCVDYFSTGEFITLIFNLKKRALAETRFFVKALASISTVEDFLTDCGEAHRE